MKFPYDNLKKSDLRYRNSLGIAPEIKEITGGAAYGQLEKIKKLYNIIYLKNIPLLRQTIFDEKIFDKIKDHINNKIKVSAAGTIYINVWDKIKFDPVNDHGDTYRLWTKENLKFLELKEYIRSEIYAVARNKWEELAKTYLLDTVGIAKQDQKGDNWKIIKNTKIRFKNLISLDRVNLIIKKKNLIKLCNKLQANYCYFDVDNLILISEKNNFTKWIISHDFSQIELIDGKNKIDTPDYILYLINCCNYFITNFKSNINTTSSNYRLWHRLLMGFEIQNFELLNSNFYNYVLLNYPKNIFNSIKIKNNNNIFSIVDIEKLDKQIQMNNQNNSSFKINNYYLIGKEYLIRLNNVFLILNKPINIYNIENILDLQAKYFKDNIFTVDYSVKIF